MKSIDRRNFLKLAAAGSAAAAAAALPGAAALSAHGARRLSVRATAGLPAKPLPAFATQVLEGTVDLTRGNGVLTTQVFAGHAEGVSDIALPGMSRVIRITGAVRQGQMTRLTGVIDDRSGLTRGESAQVEILVNHAAGFVSAPFAGHQVTLDLAR